MSDQRDLRTEERDARLTDHASFLESLWAAAPCLVFRFRSDTLITTYVSPNIGWLLGYSPDEAVGGVDFWKQIVHPEDSRRMRAALLAATGNHLAQFEQECRCRGSDGRYRWFHALMRIEYGADGRAGDVLGYALDVGDRKDAEEQLREARALSDSILEHLPAMVQVKHAADLRYARFNRAAEDLLGLTREEVLGRSDTDLFPQEVAEEYLAKDREVLDARKIADIGQEVVHTRDREPRVLHTKKVPILDSAGEPIYLLSVSTDITEHRTAHEQVRLARLEAERASRAKSEFLSRMSHDLRTPLNAILGFAQLLEMDRLSAEQCDSVQQILRGGLHLLELINEVLDIARIEAGQLSLAPEPIAVADVVTQVVDLVRPLGAPRGISVTADVGAQASLHVRADRQRLIQVLMNLVGNAVKYNRDEGQVRVSCEPIDSTARIRVADTGPGIPPEKLDLLFQPFERLGAEQTAIEGTGLGLAVAKGLTEAMNGRIGVESHVDAGSTFWIDLPRAPAPLEQQSEAVRVAPGQLPTSGVILYVEDNRSNVRLLERLLARRPGIRLTTTATGHGALDLVRRERPDLILLDLHLPDLSGEEVLRRLWADPDTRRIPVAVLSADAMASQQQRLLATGAVAYLTKPLDLAKLLHLLDEQLAARPAGGAR
jgi:PAS domain S-box-containing protein